MSRGSDAGTRLVRVLEAGAPGVCVTARRSTRWASITFTGARHALSLAAPASPAVEQWLADLPDANFTVPGHLIAEVVIKAVTATPERLTAEIEVLTLEDQQGSSRC